jgi:hypothetical protein
MTADVPPPPPAVPAQELRGVTWVYGTFDITSDAVTVRQRKVGPFGKAREAVYPLTDITSAEVYGSNLTLRLPCLISLTLVLGVLATLLLVLTRL